MRAKTILGGRGCGRGLRLWGSPSYSRLAELVSFPDPFCARARNLKLGGGERPGKGSGKSSRPSTSLVPRPLPPGKGSGDFRRISWSNKMAAYWNVNAPIRLQNSSFMT